MRAFRVVLALLLATGPLQAQPVVDILSHYSIPADETAASAPEGDAPAGSGRQLAALEANLAFVSESLEAFAHPQDADRALSAAKPGLPSGAARFFKDRTSALNALYRTLAVVDYTWALRFPNPTCTPAAKRSALLRSDDGLFLDPESGRTSAWMTALLGPGAEGQGLEAALDRASATADVNQAEYARLRVRLSLLTKTLTDRNTRDDARAGLYCARAEIRGKLAAANSSGLVLAARSAEEKSSHQGVVIIAGRTAEGLEVRGAGVVVDTKSGIRVLTDRRLGSGEVVALFDGNAAPVELSVDREDEASGLLLLRPDGDLGEPLTLAETAPKNDDLVFVLSHSDRLGAWTKTQGLVTSAGADQFQSDAVADASMTGGAVLNDEGRIAGVLALRRDAASQTDWPLGIPAPALRVWLDGGRAPAAAPVALTDQGTTRILTASRPLLQSVAVGGGAITAGYEFDTPTQWGNVHARCVANCSDNAPQTSYSDNGSRELGEALGKLAAVGVQALIYKGIPALFRGIGSLFKTKPRQAKAQAANIEAAPEKIEKLKVEPPKPVCTFEPVKLPKTIGGEQAEFGMRFSCNEAEGAPKINLGGHTIIVSVGWKGAAPSTFSITTDAYGYASLPIKVQSVEIAARRAFDDLDKNDPDKARASTGPKNEVAPADGSQ